MSESKFRTGQQVWLKNWRTRRGADTAVEVVKIGRKYATVVLYGRERKFDLETGQAPDESGYYIETEADRAENRARAEAVERLESVGFRRTCDFPRGLSVDALNQIADIAAADLKNKDN